jgi:hypothetical protein
MTERKTAADDICQEFLASLSGVRRRGNYWMARCPSHDDTNPSLSVSEAEDRILINCHAGCPPEQVVAAVGWSMADLFSRNGWIVNFDTERHKKREQAVGEMSLEGYAEFTGLPEEFLRELGIREATRKKCKCLLIDYHNENGEPVSERRRFALHKTSEGVDNRFEWKAGDRPMLYGLQWLPKIRESGQYVLLVEGESDLQILRYHKINALGIPGVNNFREEWASLLAGIEKIFLVVEPDAAGVRLAERLVQIFGERLYLMKLGEHKDIRDLQLADPEGFKDRLRKAFRSATSYREFEQARREETVADVWELCKDLANCANILDEAAKELKRSGFVGQEKELKIVFLAVISRLLEEPVSVVIKGLSSSGKSFLVKKVLELFPEDAYYALTSLSDKAMAHSKEPLKHRFLVIYEAAGAQGELQDYFIRSLLSEGRIRYEFAEATPEGVDARLVEREGPTGLLITTTSYKLHDENETRYLTLRTNDSEEQTAAVLRAEARKARGMVAQKLDTTKWHSLQTWLKVASVRDVDIPYADELARLVKFKKAPRLRRDFNKVLTLIKAHAFLHQSSRSRDKQGRVLASVDDYAAVQELIGNYISEGVEQSVPEHVRETVVVLRRLYDDLEDKSQGITGSTLKVELDVDKGTVSRRLGEARRLGFVRNLEESRGRPGRWAPGEPLPENVEILPEPDEVLNMIEGCTVARVAETRGDTTKNNFVNEEEKPKKYSSDSPSLRATATIVQPRGSDEVSTKAPESNGRRLTEEEARQAQKLIAEGMTARFAREAVLKGAKRL